MSENSSQAQGARIVVVDAELAGQRIDNFLMREFRALPRARIYSMLRKGEVRVNGGRRKAPYRLVAGDKVRVPPLRLPEPGAAPSIPGGLQRRLASAVVYEDAGLLVINKPSGLAVHGGSGLSFGLIEALRVMRPELRHMELVHRLDRDTSGLIMLAKKRSVLKALHGLLRDGGMSKQYLALVGGSWPRRKQVVNDPLEKNVLQSGERMVRVSDLGKPSRTEFECLGRGEGFSLMRARPVTGRTHQIRVHCQAAGHPIAGDDKYGDEAVTAKAQALGLDRLFLHAERLEFVLDGRRYKLHAPLDKELNKIISKVIQGIDVNNI